MLKIGITGGIGSGKSIVCSVFKLLGVPVFDADLVARNIIQSDPTVKKKIIQEFGESSFNEGILNRSFLAEKVFINDKELQKLNNITHPATIKASKVWMENQTAIYVIKEAALLFESGSASELDYVIGVFSPIEMRIKRVMNRSHLSEQEVMDRMNKQMPESKKMELCDYVIINDETQLLIPQIMDLHQKFNQKK